MSRKVRDLKYLIIYVRTDAEKRDLSNVTDFHGYINGS